ncbi:LMBR1-like membrane protein-domain-containing protein [Sporodiniella umbellata]|nr:LMBR1-like membrane protein-domain-containing protein [Sporodiniella umbellata]
MMQAYMNTGDFTISQRIKSAIQINLRFYSIYLFVGTFGLFYLVFGNGYTTREKIQSYVMAAANSWGLFLVIIFMGYGLVAVPRSLWHSGNYTRHLIQLYASAAKLKEECIETEIEFTEVARVHVLQKQSDRKPSNFFWLLDNSCNIKKRKFRNTLHKLLYQYYDS